MARQIWSHKHSGEKYVVETTTAFPPYNTEVVSAAGPLHHSEIEAVMRDGGDSDPELVEDIDGDQDSYAWDETPVPN